jgi:nitrogen fixation protein FixH
MSRLRIHWGIAVAIAYTVFASATAGFVAFAMSHPVQLVSSDYYERSLAHDAHLAAVARTRALGPGFSVEVTAGGDALIVTLPAKAAAGARGRVTFYRPADASADRTVTLDLDAHGEQRVPLAGLAAGHWRARVEWTALGKAYYAEHAVALR